MATTTGSTITTQETGLPVGTWQIDPIHSSLEFQVRNMGLVTVKGFFADFEGSLEVDEDGHARAQGTVQAASLHTRSEKRDEHLRAPDFFDVDRFPELRFRSTRIEQVGDQDYQVHGELTIKDVTREVTLIAELGGRAKDPWGNERVGFVAKTSIDRKDFGLGWNQVLEAGGLLVGNKVEIELDVQAVPAAAAQAA